ncbi:MAG: cholest-4-en-3-one 26-monooxygenase, partial [Actinomycetota bacterium]|nr:cholest-4-en-3-one 26-monooxygenase [Actinomycetota bacterium]
MELSDINLLDRDAFAKGVPHEWFTYLRANHPVYKHEEPDGPGFWVITKYDDVVTVGRDGATYSSDQKRGGVVVLEEQPDMNFEQGGNLMLTMDAPEHTRYRKLVNRGFTPRQMRMLEPHIRELTAKIVDEVIEQGGCDYVVDVAAEVPLQVIAEMLGVPQEDRHKLFEWSNRMIGSEDPEYIVSEEEVMNAQVEMFMYANELAAARRAEPRDDIISALLNAEVDGDQLSEMDFNLFFLLIAVAGNETTRNSISHGIKAFC